MRTDLEEKFLLDAKDDSNRKKRCQDCKFNDYDMDGNFCAHINSLSVANPFGQSLRLARSTNGICGPDGKLFEGN